MANVGPNSSSKCRRCAHRYSEHFAGPHGRACNEGGCACVAFAWQRSKTKRRAAKLGKAARAAAGIEK